jgi:IS66 Orf2 like protein
MHYVTWLGHLVKILWHDGIGMSLYAKRLEQGRVIWSSPAKPVPAKHSRNHPGAAPLYA